MMARNSFVEQSVELLIEKVDEYISGKHIEAPPNQRFRLFFRSLLEEHGGSVRLASAFLIFYSALDADWDGKSVPTGIRGKYGDKKLGSALKDRYITYHKNVTALNNS